MLPLPKREMITNLLKEQRSIREVSRIVGVSRNTVRRLKEDLKQEREPKTHPLMARHGALIREVFKKCNGNAVRVHEMLREIYAVDIPYSTLTRLLREAHLREPKRPVGEYHFQPGEEMQFDTSPHRLEIGGRQVTAQCASLVLAYSRRMFVAYFPRFTRFEAKWFLSEAMKFMKGSCRRCLIDNTSVVLASGSGEHARIAPVMADHARAFGFTYRAHRVGNPERKARVERPFHYIENNFLAGRHFQSYEDLNQQALSWCQTVANVRQMRALGMSPEAAFVHEASELLSLPPVFPPVYEAFPRVVDSAGYVHLDVNRYSVPWRLIGKRVEVFKYPDKVVVSFRGKKVTEHDRLIGRRHGRAYHRAHHPRQPAKNRDAARTPDEAHLKGYAQVLDTYMAELKKRVRGRGVATFKRLLELKRTYPKEALTAAVEQAYQYGLYDLKRLETLILEQVAGEFFLIDLEEESPCD